MKKKKLGNGGFVLIETLIVSVFIVAIFAVLYNNFYPLIGEYEKREVYDDIDGKYAAYWFKRIIQHESVTFSAEQLAAIDETNSNSPGYFRFNCDMVGNVSMKSMCEEMIEKAQVKGGEEKPNIFITKYYLGDKEVTSGVVHAGFKTKINKDNTFTFDGGMHKYLKFLPDYRSESLNNAQYRVIIEFERAIDDNNSYLAYSTIEVKK